MSLLKKTTTTKVRIGKVWYSLFMSHFSVPPTAQVLPGFVKSVEDHGYIIDFGVSGKSGFLLKKNASELVKVCGGRKKWLYPGQVVQCVVLSGTDTKAVSVAANPAQVSSAILSQELLVGVGSLLPGNLVKATVAQVSELCLVRWVGWEAKKGGTRIEVEV